MVKANLAGGPNSVLFDDFSRSAVGVVRVDLGPPTDPIQDRGATNGVQVLGTAGADRIRIGGTPAAGATVTGLGPTAVITRAQELTVLGDASGSGADDVIDAGLLAAGTVGRFTASGADGNDTLIGHPGRDALFGDSGDNRLEGRGGDDILDGGSGTNIIIP